MVDYKTISSFPEADRDWTDEQWKDMIEYLVDTGMVKYREIASLVLGHLNPSQVGTSVASNKFEHLCRTYGLTMANVRFEEAWAMAKWLQREGKYYISEDSKY